MSSVIFRKHFVKNPTTNEKVKVFYSLDNRIDQRKCVTIYEQGYQRKLGNVFKDTINNSDSMTDYFESSRVVLFEDHPLYSEARTYIESIKK